MRFLRQSTASQEILLGPFVATADGSAQTGLTIANTDIKLLKGGATSEGNKNSGGGTHIAGGRYSAVLDATDTDTVGILEVSCNPASGIPWNKSYYVLEEAVYDMLFAASALGYIANAPVNVAQFGGSNGTFASGRPEVNTTHAAGTAWGSGAITAASIASDAITAAKIADNAIDAGAIASDAITAAKIATGAITSAKFAAGAITAAAIATDAIDADALAADAIAEINVTVDTAISDAALATAAELAKVPKSDGTATWNATALASINAQVVDGLNVDTYAEPGQGAPGATLSLAAKIGFLYKAWRNRSTQTASQYSLYNDDASTVDHKASFSDNGTTADRGEIATGP